MGLVDELLAGGPVLSAPDLAGELGLATAALAGALLTVPMLVGTVLEAAVLAVSDRWDRRVPVVGGLLGMAAGQVGIALAPDVWTLALAVSVWMTAAGVATGAAEVALVAARPDDVDRTMSRWGLLGAVGDLVAPLAFAGFAAGGLGWRAALGLGAAVAIANALAVWAGGPLRARTERDSETETLGEALRGAVTDRALVMWLLAATACTLLDEILVAFGALWLRAHGAGAVGQGMQVALFAVGGAAGLAWVERGVADRSPHRVLIGCAAVCAVAYVGWLVAPWPAIRAAAITVLGAATAPMWALCTARAYSCGRSPGIVAAVARLGVPFEILAPLLLGLVADRWGLAAAMALLLVQPAVVALVAAADRRRRRVADEEGADGPG